MSGSRHPFVPATQVYMEGMYDGATMVLDHLEGRKTKETQPEGVYEGPMPEELKTWIAEVRSRMAKLDEPDDEGA